MNVYTKFLYRSLAIVSFLLGVVSCSNDYNSDNSNVIKVALRDVGHHLLLANKDSISVVKPILDVGENKYELTFENTLVIRPDSLVNQIKTSFEKASLPKYYLTEVIKCNTQEVVYSYAMHEDIEKGIIPCGGRELEAGCYRITVHFTKTEIQDSNRSKYLYFLGLGVILLFLAFIYKKKKVNDLTIHDTSFTSIGLYKFYPEQNKLIKEAIEISLSKKECELLALFVAQPNQLIKRDELTKKIWEDNGVIVGRSLDTYISKLRKKLKEDTSIKLTNVHGVGYKLEVE